MSDTVFIGRPYFTKDTGGFAVVPKGSKSVYVAFDRDYTDTPIVNASISLEDTDATTTGDAILKGDVRYIISNKSVHGFTIRLNAKAPEDIRFSWIALAVKDAKTFTERNNAYEGDDITEAPPATDVSTTTTPLANNTSSTTPQEGSASGTTSPSAEGVAPVVPDATAAQTQSGGGSTAPDITSAAAPPSDTGSTQ
jgi:hypothetical protein